jgi:NDP-sugar pyrophosphorylase family protein
MKAVILAGGLGTRLKPFTEVIPKPLLPIGESSVLEIQILSLKKHGVDEIFIATNYRSEYVEAFLGDGSKYDVSISYSKEDKPLGTCGPIKLLEDKLNEPFILMNGDILTTLDFTQAYKFALGINTNLVVITKEIVTPFHFGKVVSDGDYILDIHEKPDFKLEILAGIYILKPAIFDIIPKTYYGIDSLIKDMLAKNLKVGKYLMKEYWLDIGRIDDYQIAQNAYKQHFNGLKNNIGE